MSVLEDIKKKYNALVIRRDKADEFYSNADISQDKKDKWLPEYQNLIQQLSTLIVQYERVSGKSMSKEEVWEGFK